MSAPPTVVVIGVEGAGKSTLGRRLARCARPAAGRSRRLPLRAQHRQDPPGSPPLPRRPLGLVGGGAAGRPGRGTRRRRLFHPHQGLAATRSRLIGDVRFVWLRITEAEAFARCTARRGHFARADLVASQFATLQLPEADEVDVQAFDATAPHDELFEAVLAALSEPARHVGPLATRGGLGAALDADDLDAIADELAGSAIDRDAKRVLLVPPDQTRAFSRRGRFDLAVGTATRSTRLRRDDPAGAGHPPGDGRRRGRASLRRTSHCVGAAGSRLAPAGGRARKDRCRRGGGAQWGPARHRGRRRGGVCPARRLGSGDLARPGDAPRGHRHGRLHEESPDRARRVVVHRRQPPFGRVGGDRDDHGRDRQPSSGPRRHRLRPHRGPAFSTSSTS